MNAATPRIDALCNSQENTPYSGHLKVVGGIDVSDVPSVRANDAALELLREMAGELRVVRADITEAKIKLARIDGQDHAKQIEDVRDRLDEMGRHVDDIRGRIAVLETERKPGRWLAGESVKFLLQLAAGAGVLAVGVALGHSK